MPGFSHCHSSPIVFFHLLERKTHGADKVWTLAPDCLGLNPDPAIYKLQDLGQITRPWTNDLTFVLLYFHLQTGNNNSTYLMRLRMKWIHLHSDSNSACYCKCNILALFIGAARAGTVSYLAL